MIGKNLKLFILCSVIYSEEFQYEFYRSKFARWPADEPRDTLEATGASKEAKCIDGLCSGVRRG